MVGLSFLEDENNDRALYDKALNIKDSYFNMILFYLCSSHYALEQYVLCGPIVDLLKKLMYVYPDHTNPPKDIVDKIGFDCYRKKKTI